MSQPTLKTVKRLFAISGNRCAFQRCLIPLVTATGTVFGEICHIKAHSPDGPRYDPTQSDEERNGFDNLILLCAIHHKLIDDQPQEFTVDIIKKMKAEHQMANAEMEGGEREASVLLTNSGFSGSIVQSSGAGGVNVAVTGGSVIVNTGHSASSKNWSLGEDRRSDAMDRLWSAVLALRDSIPPAIKQADIYTEGEYAKYMSSDKMTYLIEKLNEDGLNGNLLDNEILNIERYRPFIGEVLWNRFSSFRTFIARVCLITAGRIGNGSPWYKDQATVNLLSNVIGSERVTEALNREAGKFHWVLQCFVSTLASQIGKS